VYGPVFGNAQRILLPGPKPIAMVLEFEPLLRESSVFTATSRWRASRSSSVTGIHTSRRLAVSQFLHQRLSSSAFDCCAPVNSGSPARGVRSSASTSSALRGSVFESHTTLAGHPRSKSKSRFARSQLSTETGVNHQRELNLEMSYTEPCQQSFEDRTGCRKFKASQ